jgi:KDO2-lipid IV(A) lauroyltransferase
MQIEANRVISLAQRLSRWPLGRLHGVGAALAWVFYFSSARERRRIRKNLQDAGFGAEETLRQTVTEHGKGMMELPALWLRSSREIASLVRDVNGIEIVEAAERMGKGIVYLTPHLGSFEVAAQWLALRAPMTVLYRPPRRVELEPLMLAGRNKEGMKTATTDLKGVRVLLKALRKGETIGMLPDQVPSKGEGEWADFFGRPAYTMTLATRLAENSGAPIVICYTRRLPQGAGFELNFSAMPERLPQESDGRWVNRAMENLISRCPSQYLWSYRRHKRPAGVEPPRTALD